MFSRKDRLPRSAFGAAMKTGRRFSSSHFLVLAPEGIHGYAVVIPKKVIRLSSARHLLKRQVIEVLHSISLPEALLVFPRSSIAGVHYQDIRTELTNLISTIPR